MKRFPEIAWVSRLVPLFPSAVVAIGDAAPVLARRLLALSDEQRARLVGAASPGVLIVCGEELPWVDGVAYLGVDPAAAGLLLPTTRRPDLPPDLFARAVYARFPDATRPLAVLESGRVLPLGAARAIDAEAVRRWLEGRG